MKPHAAPARPGRAARKAPRADRPEDDVELNSDESFPASDPPSWTPVARVGEPREPVPAVGRVR